MPSVSQNAGAQRYWRSLDDLADAPEFRQFVEREFPNYAPEMLTRATRRGFLKVMGASLALAGLTGCRWPKEAIVPNTRQPEGRTPGQPVRYATAFDLCGAALGLLVTSYDGRPIKIEGNEQHPSSLGKTDALAQAAVLELYDPDRSVSPMRSGGPGGQTAATTSEFRAAAGPIFESLRAKQGAGLWFLSERSSSPTLADLRARLGKALPQARWCEYEPLSRDNEREGSRQALGRAVRTHYKLDKADVVVSFDDDFLMTHPTAVRLAGELTRRRRADDGTMNRLYAFESNHSVTGAFADHRVAVRASEVGAWAWKLLETIRTGQAAAPAKAPSTPDEVLAQLAADLLAAKGKGHSAVLVGPRQPAEVHAIGHALNHALGNIGQTVTYTDEPDGDRPADVDALRSLVDALNGATVEALVILGGNPVFNAPADVGFADALAKAKTSIRLGLYNDETSHRCTWHVNAAHFLESWSDARAWDGTISVVQPLIEPLYGGLTAIELVAMALGDGKSSHELVRTAFREVYAPGGDSDAKWRHTLHDGLLAGSASAPASVQFNDAALKAPAAAVGTYEIVFAQDYKLHDGRFANNAWLQELPDPMTKLTWDNAALISPHDAEKLGVRTENVLSISVGGRKIDIPACVVPGHATGSITLLLGNGRREVAGKVAGGAGVNVYALRTAAAPHFVGGATVSRSGATVRLATTQDHHAIESRVGDEETRKRVTNLYRAATLAEYTKHPDFAKHRIHVLPQVNLLYNDGRFDAGHKWGMTIDLTACTGCSACVAACQAENNIPVVGKGEVLLGREMHWIRIDRYFAGDPHSGSVEVAQQPVPCMHCENAPCEQVCPVAATVHDKEGLNVMVYNRCVGTRYCSNNCPYKVRRFNWFYNHHGPKHPRSQKDGVPRYPAALPSRNMTEIEKLVHNPNVTVRSRGVMEKCTYCVQRINAVKIVAKNDGRPVVDGEIVPACAQACPTEAIVFGDLSDMASRVRRLTDHPRTYSMLAELNTQTRTNYLGKLRNPAGAAAGGHDDEHAAPAEHA